MLSAGLHQEVTVRPHMPKPGTSHEESPGGERRRERKCSTTFLERTREGRCQSGEHWNRLKGNFGETSERRSGGHAGFSDGINTILN